MRRGGLFWRIFSSIMGATLVAVLVFTSIIATTQQRLRQESYENEVRLQAREIADYMNNLDQLSFVRDNVTMRYIVGRKVAEIYDRYNADIWIVSFNSGIVQVLDRSWNTSQSVTSEPVLEQLARIQRGEEIRETGLFEEMGDQIVTIGVPWRFSDGHVVGAVLLHISTDSLRVGIGELLPQIIFAALLTLTLGTLLSILLARGQIKPLKEIDNAVREFTTGDLSRRVELHCGGELEALGNSINHMAEELSQLEDSRRHFVAAVSHELRSPMTCMRGYVEALLDGTIPPENAGQYLRIVLDETNRLTALVHDLLELSRFESGKFPLQIAPFNANETIRRILINFEPRIDAKHADVNVLFAPDPLWAMGDASRINQVISNFIDNALKFMPEEGGLLTLSTEIVGKCVRFTVRDNGSGISDKDIGHIFERFYKADRARTSGMGTGLGLSICNLIIRQHNSEISVSSRSGDTAFSFLLPVCDAPAPVRSHDPSGENTKIG